MNIKEFIEQIKKLKPVECVEFLKQHLTQLYELFIDVIIKDVKFLDYFIVQVQGMLSYVSPYGGHRVEECKKIIDDITSRYCKQHPLENITSDDIKDLFDI